MAPPTTLKPIRILLINPNSSADMTHGMEQALQRIDLPPHISITPYTAPTPSPASINDDRDVQSSHDIVFADLTSAHPPLSLRKDFDAALVACFSVHSLVPHLAWKFDAGQNAGGIDDDDAQLAVTGIFEASILTALSLLRLPAAPFSGPADQPRQWGIVTTGKFWEDHLADGVATFLGQGQCHSSTEPAAGAAETDHQVQQVGAAAAAAAEEQKTLSPPNLRFAGVQSTGLNAGDFHGPDAVPPQVVRQKMHEATARLLSNGRVDVVVMGCAGMAGLETIIREVAIETYGPDAGMRVYIVDGVKAGVVALEGMVRERRMFR